MGVFHEWVNIGGRSELMLLFKPALRPMYHFMCKAQAQGSSKTSYVIKWYSQISDICKV